jgi:hypothetical protein
MHGVGQGNGAGPAIWAVVSTPLLNMLRNSGVGSFFTSPISGKDIRFVGYAFMDDTDLIQTAHDGINTGSDVAKELQRALDIWEGGLHATGGAIVPEKNHWYLVDFRWNGGEWKYLSVADSPASLWVKDIKGERKLLKRLGTNEAATTLGVDIAADGNNESQFNRMKELSIKWADQIRTGRLKRSEVYLALHSTLWKTLSYPLPCTSLSKKQCDKIMATALLQALPAMGICRYFPRSVVHGPLSRMGLGIPHIHSLQEIARLKDMIHHTDINTFTGQLYRGTLEAMIIKVGVGMDIFQYPFQDLQHLATDSLVKTTWETLSANGLLVTTDIAIPLPRAKGARGPVLLTLNYCRLYLKVFHLSDIADFSGTYITEHAWQGIASSMATNCFTWPNQGKPSANAWCIWRSLISQHITA